MASPDGGGMLFWMNRFCNLGETLSIGGLAILTIYALIRGYRHSLKRHKLLGDEE